jgi:hypothetical protein
MFMHGLGARASTASAVLYTQRWSGTSAFFWSGSYPVHEGSNTCSAVSLKSTSRDSADDDNYGF